MYGKMYRTYSRFERRRLNGKIIINNFHYLSIVLKLVYFMKKKYQLHVIEYSAKNEKTKACGINLYYFT